MCGSIVAPKDVYVLILKTCDYVKLSGKRGIRLQIELSLLISWL